MKLRQLDIYNLYVNLNKNASKKQKLFFASGN